MNDDPLNFDPLDPTRDESFGERVRSIAVDAMAARRAVRAKRPTLMRELGAWLHPALVGAGLVAAACAAAIVNESRRGAPPALARGAPAAVILGIPAPLIALARSAEEPSVSQLVAALGFAEQGDSRAR